MPTVEIENVQSAPPKGTESMHSAPSKGIESMQSVSFYNTGSQ